LLWDVSMTKSSPVSQWIGPAHRLVRRLAHPAWFGTLHRTTPISRAWGYDRGLPIDRHYIDRFLSQHATDIRSSVLEVGDTRYSRRFAPSSSELHTIDVDPSKSPVVRADLCDLAALPRDRYKCFVCAQTLQYVSDPSLALRGAHQLLTSGGVLLATVPALAAVDPGARAYDRWRFTVAQTKRWLEDAFGADAELSVTPRGNVLAACASLMGLARQDLDAQSLDESDPDYPVILCIRAVKR
jgi:hypothetical protein